MRKSNTAHPRLKPVSLSNFFNSLQLNPPLVLLIGFASLITLGAILLSMPWVTKSGQSIGLLDAFFTAGSASCVTGLTVVNTVKTFNLAGQIIILCLIQAGGLGIMTLTTLFPLIMGKKIGLKSRQILKEQLNLSSLSGIIRLLKYVVKFTLIVEGVGALLLASRFIPAHGWLKGAWEAVFHSVSAFCNAGFDILGDSIYPWRDDPVINWTIMALVVIGGLGFLVTQEILQKRKFRLLSTHSKLVLIMSGGLILFGAVIFFVLEYSNPDTLLGVSLPQKIQASFFQSIISRTAGFYSLPTHALHEETAFLLIFLMFIGGSPGSTAGGLKTTTLGVLLVTTIATIKGQHEPTLFNKHLGSKTIRRALALIVVGIFLIVFVVFTLTLTENDKFIELLFETVSAYGTVGLSMGVTPHLSAVGKIIIIGTMFAGRVGPLTLGFAMANRNKRSKIRLPEANITVG
jgi:trk system potassium uptake protein TrkH